MGGAIDPQLMQHVLALNAQQPKQQQIQRQLALANQLRASGPDMSKSQSSISTPNYMGAIAQALAGYKANQLDKQAQTSADALAQERIGAYQKYMQGMNPGATPQPTPAPAAMGAAPNPFDSGG